MSCMYSYPFRTVLETNGKFTIYGFGKTTLAAENLKRKVFKYKKAFEGEKGLS